jgi:DNA uptake protein ComE-like DNA-binding protein
MNVLKAQTKPKVALLRSLYTLILAVATAGFSTEIQAQDDDLSALIAEIMETIADKNEEDEPAGMEELVEYYTQLSESPLDLNTASDEDLSQLVILTDFQIFSLRDYIKEYGKMLSIHELTLVPGFDEKTVLLLTPFVTTGAVKTSAATPLWKVANKGSNTLFMRASTKGEKSKGYIIDESSGRQYYKGQAFGLMTRYKYAYRKRFQVGFTADKDQGEEFFTGSNKSGFDFYSFHLMVNDVGPVKRLIAGDFKANFGQGLSIWNNFSLGKSAYTMSVKRRNNGFSAYTSADETTYMRGLASTLQFGDWEISPFVSHRKVDATLDETGYTSLTANGLHRTPNEIARKNTLPLTVAGINIGTGRTSWRVGATAVYTHYHSQDNRGLQPYNLFTLHKPSNANFSVDYKWLLNNISLFGEAAISANGGKALLTGMSVNVHHAVQFSALYRNYQVEYQAVYAKSFGENSQTNNERGLYFGVSVAPHRNWKFTAYFDSYSFPWLRYGVNSPSTGWDYLLQANYTPNNNFDLSMKLQTDKNVKNITGGSNAVAQVQDISRNRLTLQATYALAPGLSLRSRVALCLFSPEKQAFERGLLITQDIKYLPPALPMSLSLRYAIFDTDSWNTRLYAYESDVLYAFSVPAYYDKGCRYYFNAGYKFANRVQLWFRISQTYYFNKTTISSGLSEVEGNKQTDIKIQLQIKI